MKKGFKFLDDDTEIVIIAKTYENALIQIEKLNSEHENGYKYLGEIPIYYSESSIVCPVCKEEPKYTKIEVEGNHCHWKYSCKCHEEIRTEKEDAKDKYWLWHPSFIR